MRFEFQSQGRIISIKKSDTTWIDSKFAEKSISEVLFCIWPLQVLENWAYWWHATPKFKVLGTSGSSSFSAFDSNNSSFSTVKLYRTRQRFWLKQTSLATETHSQKHKHPHLGVVQTKSCSLLVGWCLVSLPWQVQQTYDKKNEKSRTSKLPVRTSTVTGCFQTSCVSSKQAFFSQPQ